MRFIIAAAIALLITEPALGYTTGYHKKHSLSEANPSTVILNTNTGNPGQAAHMSSQPSRLIKRKISRNGWEAKEAWKAGEEPSNSYQRMMFKKFKEKEKKKKKKVEKKEMKKEMKKAMKAAWKGKEAGREGLSKNRKSSKSDAVSGGNEMGEDGSLGQGGGADSEDGEVGGQIGEAQSGGMDEDE